MTSINQDKTISKETINSKLETLREQTPGMFAAVDLKKAELDMQLATIRVLEDTLDQILENQNTGGKADPQDWDLKQSRDNALKKHRENADHTGAPQRRLFV
jgi:hypothetical protein